MSAHVLLNVSNGSRKNDKMQGLPSIISFFRHEFGHSIKDTYYMLDPIYYMT